MKARAPPAPQVPQPAPRRIFRTTESQGETTGTHIKENMLRPTVELRLTLPQGFQATVTEDGSKALMDLLVELCSRYHLNPALHTLELLTPEGHPLGFKPNALLGSLNVACILIKEKVLEEKLVRRPAPKVPEKTVRLMVNYHGSQKAVVRVNPLLPLQDLVPVICDKCEFDPAFVVLLKDSIGRHELPLDKSLSQLGIKELYVHDKSLVLQPKMASAPALNYSDSIYSSTTNLARAEKKGLLGIFQFSRRKSKTETTSLDMDYCDDKVFQNTEAHPNAPCVDQPNPLRESQSAINISRRSPKAETKKRRAPAPPGTQTPSFEHPSFDNYQISLGLESQQRKRKAPAPPPTPVSLTPGSDDTFTSVATTPVSQLTETPTPSSRSKVAQSSTVTTTVVIQNVKPDATVTALPAVCSASQAPSSPTPSCVTSESLAVQYSSSELSQSLDDSEADPGSNCSTTTGSTISRSAQARTITKSTTSSSMMEKSEMTNKAVSDVTSTSSSRSDTESAMNLKMDEAENNRHSGVAWLHSMQSPAPKCQSVEILATEETVSLGSNSSGSTLPDQGYAASEGGEDSGLVSSPSETHTTSPDGSLSLDGSSGGERLVGTVPDHFSDSDEGCATWESRHRCNDITPRPEADRLKVSGADDQDLSAQLHQTLTDLESDLTDSNGVPVSVLDLDVPVTAIDEVLADDEFWTDSITIKVPSFGAELQNKNNNAHTAVDFNKGYSTDTKLFSQHQQNEKTEESTSKKNKKENSLLDSKLKERNETDASVKTKAFSEANSDRDGQMNTKNSDVKRGDGKKDMQQEKKPALPPVSQRDDDLHRVHHNISSSNALHGKITPNVTSRFGMKTFTVVPPKPSIMHAAAGDPASRTPGAIKIDEQGNMVKVAMSHSQHRDGGFSESKNSQDSPLHGKAKAFWSSNERQDGVGTQSKGLTDKAKEGSDSHKCTRTNTSETTLKSTDKESLKHFQGTLNQSAVQMEPKKTTEDSEMKDEMKQKDLTKVEDKISTSINIHHSSQMPTLPPPLITDTRRDLCFLKPSRRTSSQYVASAITKYTPKSTTKSNSNTTTPESLLKTQSPCFQKSGRSIQINPQHSFRSNNESNSDFKSNPPGPKRSTSYPERISDSQEDGGGVVKGSGDWGKSLGSTKGSFRIQETQHSSNKQSAAPTQVNVNVSDTFKTIQHRSPSPAPSSPQHSSAKPPTALRQTGHQEEASNDLDMTAAGNPPIPDEKPVPVTVSDSGVTVFGPVKKFKPVICRSVEKETSLHSSLMEAIQTGGGRERLKKISASGVSSMNKPSYADDENERSALMAAIRAQGSSGRLRKTKSEAAEELEMFRKAPPEENKSTQVSTSPSFTSASPLAFVPSPVPPAPPVAPPPPVLPLSKSFKSLPNVPMNPAIAREAMLEAIRSGSAAEKLKKVAAPPKTVQVNGRLGTIKATSSTLS